MNSGSDTIRIIRAFLRGKTTTQPNVANSGPPLENLRIANALGSEPPPAELVVAAFPKTNPVQIMFTLLGTIGFLYFARPVVLPIFLACVAGMTLKPLIRWLSCCYLPPAFSAAIVLCFLMCGVMLGFFQLGRPALAL